MGAPKLQNNLRVLGRKNYINQFAKLEPITGVLLTDFIEKEIIKKQRRKSKSFGRNYITLLQHISNFSEQVQAEIYTNSINEEFGDDFINYLESQELSANYIKNLIGLTKGMVTKAAKNNYAVDPTYQDINYEGEDPFSVYLTMNEITRIYYFHGLTKKQERIRDLFVVGCLTGLRYSDYSTLTEDNFDGDFIIKITKKTKTKVKIPVHDYVREIYEKYEGEVSPGLSIQHFNRYIKMICKKVGLTELIKKTSTKGGRIITETRPKWDLISSHTARRSAATNMYLTGRMKTYQIMSITGHSTEKSFFRYIRVTQEDTVKQIAGDNFWNM